MTTNAQASQQSSQTNAQPQVQAKKQPMTPTEAASRIAALMEPKKTNPDQPQKKVDTQQVTKKKPAPAVTDDAVGVDALEAEAGGAAEDDADPLAQGTTETEEDQTEGEEIAGDDAAETAEDEQDSETLHSIVVDGKESKVTYEELISGYQRQADYTRKMQSLAKERKDVEAVKEQVRDLPKVQKAYQDGAETFSKNAQLVMVALEQRFMPKPPDQALLDKDPAAYVRQKEHFQEALHFRAGLTQELQGIEAQAKEAAKKQVFEGRQKLFQEMPEMNDAANRHKLTAYAKTFGFTDENIVNEPNHVLFIWAEKARKYDEIMARKASLTPDKSKPKVAKQLKASEGHKAIQVRQRTAMFDTHKREKSVDSAARAIAGIGLK